MGIEEEDIDLDETNITIENTIQQTLTFQDLSFDDVDNIDYDNILNNCDTIRYRYEFYFFEWYY